MGSRGNQPLLAVAMAPYSIAADFDGKRYFAIPGGVVPGLNIVAVGGALLSPGDFDDSDGLGINLAVGIAAGTQFQLYAMGYNTGYVPVGGQLAPFRNKFINGNFDIWQRGTSLSAGTGGRYIADRWLSDSVGSTVTPSRQAFTLGQTDVPGEPQFFHRCVVASSAGAGNYANLQQKIEGVRTFAGQTATLSFRAKADAPKNIAVEFAQIFGSGGSPSSLVTAIGAQLCALTTSWKEFNLPIAIPSIAGKTPGTNGDDNLSLLFWLDAGSNFNARTASLGQQSGTFDISRVQIERGSVATDFEERHPAQELMMAMRYYQKSYRQIDPPGTNTGLAQSIFDVASNLANVRFPVVMRGTPTILTYDRNGASGKITTNGASDNVTPDNVDNLGDSGFKVYQNTASRVSFHYTSNAEL